MNKKLIIATSLTMLLALPMAAMAIADPAVPNGNANISVIELINAILAFLWPIFIGFAVIMFVIAGFYFITAQGEPDGVKKARDFVIWGVVGVAVGVLAFSLPYVVQNLLSNNGVG